MRLEERRLSSQAVSAPEPDRLSLLPPEILRVIFSCFRNPSDLREVALSNQTLRVNVIGYLEQENVQAHLVWVVPPSIHMRHFLNSSSLSLCKMVKVLDLSIFRPIDLQYLGNFQQLFPNIREISLQKLSKQEGQIFDFSRWKCLEKVSLRKEVLTAAGLAYFQKECRIARKEFTNADGGLVNAAAEVIANFSQTMKFLGWAFN